MKDELVITADELPPEVIETIRAGNKIEAIRMLRASTGLGLAHAKVLIDEAARREGLQRVYPEFVDSTPVSPMLIKLLLLAVMGAIAYMFLA